MSTSRGRLKPILVGLQSNFETVGPASGNGYVLQFYDEALQPTDPLENDPILGPGQFNDREESDVAPGLKGGAGSITLPFDIDALTFWLTLLCGDGVASGDGPYTRVFQSGKRDMRYATMQLQTADDRWKVIESAAISSIDFDMTKAAGYRRFNVGVLARRVVMERVAANLPIDPALAGALDGGRAPATIVAVEINGAPAANMTGGRFTHQTGVARIDYLDGSPYGSSMEYDTESQFRIEGMFRVQNEVGANPALEYFTGEEGPAFSLALVFAFAGGSLRLDFPRCYAGRVTEAIRGPGALEFGGTIHPKQDTVNGAPAMTATLVNTVETF